MRTTHCTSGKCTADFSFILTSIFLVLRHLITNDLGNTIKLSTDSFQSVHNRRQELRRHTAPARIFASFSFKKNVVKTLDCVRFVFILHSSLF